jgi:hypothetical protein
MNSKIKLRLKPIIDILMTFALLFLMSYELLGSTAHEVVGVVIFLLFVIHHGLNLTWAKYLTKGRQSPIRIFQNILVLLVLISFVSSIVSGVVVSRHLFAFLNIKSTYAANRIHMLSAYWGFVFMSFHLGFHFNMILLMIKKKKQLSQKTETALKIILTLIFAYGIYAFFKRDIASYLFLKNQFFFLGDNENLLLYLFDYMSIMLSFATLSYFVSSRLKSNTKIRS